MTSSPRVAPSRFATHFDVVIAGGGIIGSSIAYHLASAGVGAICVVERDPTYEFAATPRSNGGIRRLFSRQQNIEMAAYGLEFYRNFAATMGVDDTPAEVSFRRQGYLFVSDAGGAEQMLRQMTRRWLRRCSAITVKRSSTVRLAYLP